MPGVNSRAWCPVFASGGRCQVSAVLSTEDGVVGRRMLCSPCPLCGNVNWSPLFAPWCSLASVWVDGQLVNGREANGPVRRWAFSAAQRTRHVGSTECNLRSWSLPSVLGSSSNVRRQAIKDGWK